MNDEQLLLRQLVQNGVMVDANLLIVLIVGIYDPSTIGSFNRTEAYEQGDYEYLNRITRYARKIIVTPQILAEVSNQTFQHIERTRGALEHFTRIMNKLKEAQESHIEKDLLLAEPRLLARFGFADHSIMHTVRHLNCVVLTVDGPLTGQLRAEGHRVINLNEIRSASWLGTKFV